MPLSSSNYRASSALRRASSCDFLWAQSRKRAEDHRNNPSYSSMQTFTENGRSLPLKICSKSFLFVFLHPQPLCESRSSSTRVHMAIIWNLSPMWIMVLIPVLSGSFHLHFSTCFLSEKELFCQILIQLSLTVEFEEKFHGFRIESQETEGNKPSLIILLFIYFNCYI